MNNQWTNIKNLSWSLWSSAKTNIVKLFGREAEGRQGTTRAGKEFINLEHFVRLEEGQDISTRTIEIGKKTQTEKECLELFLFLKQNKKLPEGVEEDLADLQEKEGSISEGKFSKLVFDKITEVSSRSKSKSDKLPQGIGRLVNLKRLGIYDYENLTELPKSIGNLRNLEKLALERCTNLEAIPNSIGNLRNLEILVLKGCTNLKAIPNSIGNCSRLKEFSLTNNNIIQELPQSFEGLDGLEYFEIQHCAAFRTLPECIVPGCVGATYFDSLLIIDCPSLSNMPKKIETLELEEQVLFVSRFAVAILEEENVPIKYRYLLGYEVSMILLNSRIPFDTSIDQIRKKIKLAIKVLEKIDLPSLNTNQNTNYVNLPDKKARKVC